MLTWAYSGPLKSRQGYLCRTNHRWAMVTLAAGQSAVQTLGGHSNCDPVISDVRSIHLLPGCELRPRISLSKVKLH